MYKLIVAFLALIILGCTSADIPRKPNSVTNDYRYLAPFVKQDAKWTYKEWGDFMVNLNDQHLCELALEWGVMDENTPGINSTWNERVKKVFTVGSSQYAIDSLGGRLAVITKMQKELIKAAYYFSYNKEDVKWNEIVLWANDKIDNKSDLKGASSYLAEKALLETFFDKNWQKLNQQEREEVIKNSDLMKLKDSEKEMLIKVRDSASAIAILKTTVLLKGFSFYTTMSSVMAATANVARITLPFAVYMGASRIVATMTGPWGWGLIAASTAISGISGLAPDEMKVLRMVTSLHLIKTKALMN